MTRQLEHEKAALLESKRREVAEARRKQQELDSILLENRRKVGAKQDASAWLRKRFLCRTDIGMQLCPVVPA